MSTPGEAQYLLGYVRSDNDYAYFDVPRNHPMWPKQLRIHRGQLVRGIPPDAPTTEEYAWVDPPEVRE